MAPTPPTPIASRLFWAKIKCSICSSPDNTGDHRSYGEFILSLFLDRGVNSEFIQATPRVPSVLQHLRVWAQFAYNFCVSLIFFDNLNF